MQDLEAALSEISRIRDQVAASTRFRGFTPSVALATGGLALAAATFQSLRPAPALDMRTFFIEWMLLGAICAALVGTDAIVRGRALHRAMADTLIDTTLRRIMPAASAGLVCAVIILSRAPEAAWMLPGLWQLLIAVGISAMLPNLPHQMGFAAGWYFFAGTATLAMSGPGSLPSPWAMGLPFGFGQLLIAAILHRAARGETRG